MVVVVVVKIWVTCSHDHVKLLKSDVVDVPSFPGLCVSEWSQSLIFFIFFFVGSVFGQGLLRRWGKGVHGTYMKESFVGLYDDTSLLFAANIR